MGRDIASVARELLAHHGAGADQEARRQLACACDEERNRDAQDWISVVFFLARTKSGAEMQSANAGQGNGTKTSEPRAKMLKVEDRSSFPLSRVEIVCPAPIVTPCAEVIVTAPPFRLMPLTNVPGLPPPPLVLRLR